MAERDFTNEEKIINVERELEEVIKKSLNWLGPDHGNSWIPDLELNVLDQRIGLYKQKLSERIYIYWGRDAYL